MGERRLDTVVNLRTALHTGNRAALVHLIGPDVRYANVVICMLLWPRPCPRVDVVATIEWLIDYYHIDINAYNQGVGSVRLQPLIYEVIASPSDASHGLIKMLLKRNPNLMGADGREDLLRLASRLHNHTGLGLLLEHAKGNFSVFNVRQPELLMSDVSAICASSAAILWTHGAEIGTMDSDTLFERLADCGAFMRRFYLARARSLCDAKYLMEHTPTVEARTRRGANVLKKDRSPTWYRDRIDRSVPLASVHVIAKRDDVGVVVRSVLNMPSTVFTELIRFIL